MLIPVLSAEIRIVMELALGAKRDVLLDVMPPAMTLLSRRIWFQFTLSVLHSTVSTGVLKVGSGPVQLSHREAYWRPNMIVSLTFTASVVCM